MSKSPEHAAAVKKAEELLKLSDAAAKKAGAAGATEEDKAAASTALAAFTAAAAEAKALEAPASTETAKEAKKGAITRIINRSKALHYVGEIRILPDNTGSEFSDELHEAALKNPGYAALIKQGLLEVK